MEWFRAALLLACANEVNSFVYCNGKAKSRFSTFHCAGNEGDYRSDVDEMKKILEESWNEKTMSHIPTNPQSGALAGTEAIMNILHDPNCERGKVIMVDIALPSLDPNFENFYDDVGAVEFCAELANGIANQRRYSDYLSNDGKIAIVVKDENLVSRAERVLKNSVDGDVAEYNDFSDFDMSSIDSSQTNLPNHRIGSFLGNVDEIPSGRNMMNDICKLVSENAVPVSNGKDEDILIISCPSSQAELIGVRWLVSKYGSNKTIIIVNNRLNPLPNELMEAETVYGVLPLIARSVGSASEGKSKNPKVVLLRRYPNDWQIHIDDNSSGLGFELISSVPAKNVGVRGPSMNFISERVKEFMVQKFQN